MEEMILNIKNSWQQFWIQCNLDITTQQGLRKYSLYQVTRYNEICYIERLG